MSISNELFLAILSMDSYNRGYDAGISDGDANDPDGLGGAGSIIGNATVMDVALPAGFETAGFYAVAYELTQAVGDMAAGTVIISYRGTDAPWTELLGTVAPIIAGDYDEDQIYLANQFYNSVKDANPNAPDRKSVV